MLTSAKNSSIQVIMAFENNNVKDANEMPPLLLESLLKSKISPAIALNFLNEEVSILLK